jgi:hypothetical protein
MVEASTGAPKIPRLSTDSRLSDPPTNNQPEDCRIADVTPDLPSSSGFPRPVDNNLLQDLHVLVIPVSVQDYEFSDQDLEIAEAGLDKSAEFWNAMSYGEFNLESTFLPQDSWPIFNETAKQLGLVSTGPTHDYLPFVELALNLASEKTDLSTFDFFRRATRS